VLSPAFRWLWRFLLQLLNPLAIAAPLVSQQNTLLNPLANAAAQLMVKILTLIPLFPRRVEYLQSERVGVIMAILACLTEILEDGVGLP
jgi:hypothetical protein